jgi:DNA-binding GntR family transcriptional regulator
MSMHPITRPSSLKESVIERLRESIVTGELELGQPLSERALAERLNVSKTPVREALAQLRVEGLVLVYPQRGAYVFTPNGADVAEMCELRQALEAAALKLAIERNPEETEKQLDKIVCRMERARRDNDRRAYLIEDTLFHQALFSCCGNSLMMRTYDMQVGKISALRTHLARRPGHTDLSFAEHKGILHAVRNRDPKLALATLDTHIGRTRLSYSQEIAQTNAETAEAKQAR